MSAIRYIILAGAFLLLSLNISGAQPKSVGAVFSYSGTSLEYEHGLSGDSFLNLCLKAETGEMFSGRCCHPGVSASFTWNLILSSWLSCNGNTIDFFAGPGALIGYGPDFKDRNGMFFGLKGRAGIQCSFERNCTISLSVSPMLGMHTVFHNEYISLKHCRSGLIYGFTPEIGIRYCF